MAAHGVRGRGQVGAPVAPGLGDRFQDLPERGHAPPRRGREVGAAVERVAVRGEPDAEGPAALAGEGLHRFHVDGVQVGPLLPVDLDAHEVLVQERRDALVLEALPLHHVAPVAGGVADAQEDGLVLGLRLLQGLRSPGVPVHGVVGVLQQVGAGLARKMIRHLVPPLSFPIFPNGKDCILDDYGKPRSLLPGGNDATIRR